MSDSLEIFENQSELSITYKWFTPKAIFLAFFCFVWDLFLVNWYAIGFTTGAPLIMFLFPLIHVAVGVGLTYYTVCLIFNKTQIYVLNGNLHIAHMPIPWWKGNKKIATELVEQLYVKEKKGSNGSVTYELRAKLRDGKDISMIATGMEGSEKLHQIEEKLEYHIGIEDYPVKGEYGKTGVTNPAPKPRRKRRKLTQQTREYNYKEGDYLTLLSKSFCVKHITQMDWRNGNSDRLLQLQEDLKDKETLLYIRQNKGIYNPFLEEKLSLLETQHINFQESNPNNFLSFRENQFAIEELVEGETFLGKNATPISTKQWFYFSKDQSSYLRIEAHRNIFSFYLGQKIDPADFDDFFANDRLELRDIDKEYLKDEDYNSFFS